MEDTFFHIWQLIRNHGGVAEFYKEEAKALWDTFTREQQREIYRAIRDKLNSGKFVNYVPTKAIMENAPKKQQQVLTYEQYFERFRTTDERDGWKRLFMPEEQRTIYVKQ